MLAALPAGWLADKYRRDRVLKVAAVIGTLAGASLAVALVDALPIQALFGAMALLGCYTGFNNAPLEALFADCIPRGKRSTASVQQASMHVCHIVTTTRSTHDHLHVLSSLLPMLCLLHVVLLLHPLRCLDFARQPGP